MQWNELRRLVKDRYVIAEELANSFVLVFEYGESGDRQVVVVSNYESLDTEWIDVSSACAEVGALAPLDALRHGFQLAVGSLCVDGDTYVVRHTARLADVDLNHFVLIIHVVASSAYQTANAIFRKSGRTSWFAKQHT